MNKDGWLDWVDGRGKIYLGAQSGFLAPISLPYSGHLKWLILIRMDTMMCSYGDVMNSDKIFFGTIEDNNFFKVNHIVENFKEWSAFLSMRMGWRFGCCSGTPWHSELVIYL